MRGRVLFVRTDPCTYDPRILKEASSLRRGGYDVCVFGWDRSGEHPADETVDGVRYMRSRIRAPYGSKLLLLFLPLFWFRAITVMLRFRPAVIHACDMDALVPALAGKFLLGTKVVYDIFDHFADKLSGIPGGLREFIRAIDSRLARLADLVIVTDPGRKRLLPGSDRLPVGIIMNVPPNTGHPPAERGGTGPVRVCYAGVIHEHRGLRLIAEATGRVEGIEVVFAGWIPRQADREFLLQQEKISYIGKVPYENALKLMGECDILLALYDPGVPINTVASSNKVYEAMGLGRPIISNRETAMAELISRLSCGVLVPYGDPGALAGAVENLRDRPDVRKEMGENGRRAFLEEYNWEIMERRLLGFYEALAHDRPPIAPSRP